MTAATETDGQVVSGRISGDDWKAWKKYMEKTGERPSDVVRRLFRQAVVRGDFALPSDSKEGLVEKVRGELTHEQAERLLGAVNTLETVLDEMTETNPVAAFLYADWIASEVSTYPKKVQARSGVSVRVEG